MGPRFRTSSQKRGRLIRVSLRRKPALARRQAKGHPPPVTNGSLPDSRFSRYTAETVFPQRVETATFIWNFHSFLLEAPGTLAPEPFFMRILPIGVEKLYTEGSRINLGFSGFLLKN